jgi:hypothetical protein
MINRAQLVAGVIGVNAIALPEPLDEITQQADDLIGTHVASVSASPTPSSVLLSMA